MQGSIGGERWTDEGVSPIVAVVMLVVITVVLAATTYLWVEGFAAADMSAEPAAARAETVDMDRDTDAEWVKVTLTSGRNAPYDGDEVQLTVTAPDGTPIETVCKTAQYADGCRVAFDMSTGSTDRWDVSYPRWVPCDAHGDHLVTLAVKGTGVLDTSVRCEGSL